MGKPGRSSRRVGGPEGLSYMIRINLLKRSLADARQLRRRRLVEFGVGVVAFGTLGLLLGLLWVDTQERVQVLEEVLPEKRMLVISQRTFEEEVEDLLNQKEQLTREVLQRNHVQRLRSQPVSILDGVSRSLDPLDLWLIAMDLDQGSLQLKGIAGSREEIFRFSQKLSQEPDFHALTILEARTDWVEDEPVVSFSLHLTVDNDHHGSSNS